MSVLNMHEAAQLVGLSYDRFRKVWPDLQLQGFPAPFIARKWDAAAVLTWIAARSGRVVVDLPPSAKQATHPPAPGRLRREREALAALRAAP